MYELIQSFYFALAVLSVIVFLDVLIKFKKSLQLKFFFLLSPFSIGMIAIIYALHITKLVFFIAFFRATFSLSILNMFSILYFPKYKKAVLGLTLFIVSVTFVFLFANLGIIPANGYFRYFKVASYDSNLNLNAPIELRRIKFLMLFLISIPMTYFWYVIYAKINLNNIYFNKIKAWTNWVILLTFISVIFNLFIHKLHHIDKFFWGDILTIIICNYSLLLILFRPNFLNNSALKIALGHKFNMESEKIVDPELFISIIENEAYYKNKNASLEGLANLLEVSSQLLSTYIYNNYSISFNDLINKYRVNFFYEIVKDPKYKNYTIDGLAKEAGFSSRQHLNKPFKKFHGGKPSDLLNIE